MKIIPFAFSLLVLAVSGPLCQLKAQTQTKPSQVLADFRKDQQSSPSQIPAATQRAVLSKVFRKYFTDDSKCNTGFELSSKDYLKAARNAGQIVPSIVDSATGSFTAPGQSQTAYVISVNECNASHADNFGTKRIAIFAGQQLIADLDVDFHSSIFKKTDLDADGIDELLMTTGDMAQGVLTALATLFSFRGGQLKILEDFGTVLEDSCASEAPGSNARAAVLSIGAATPGKMPKIRSDIYSSSCRVGAKRWQFVATGKMPE